MPTCPHCNEPLVDIVYKVLTPEMTRAEQEEKIRWGGNYVVHNNAPQYYCNQCGKKFYKNLMEAR